MCSRWARNQSDWDMAEPFTSEEHSALDDLQRAWETAFASLPSHVSKSLASSGSTPSTPDKSTPRPEVVRREERRALKAARDAALADLRQWHAFLKKHSRQGLQTLSGPTAPATPAPVVHAAPAPGPITGVTLKNAGFRDLDTGTATARITALTAALYSILGVDEAGWTGQEALRQQLESLRDVWEQRELAKAEKDRKKWPDLMFLAEPGLAGGVPVTERQKQERSSAVFLAAPNDELAGLEAPDLAVWCLERLWRAGEDGLRVEPSATGLKKARERIAAAGDGGPGRLRAVLEVLVEHRALVELHWADPVPAPAQKAAVP
ncbi:MAG: hypothetical protein M3O22_05845 [Pseudomonadota bacterium]|nr:hypothetical protein [Pseudomonadota bacterium]